MTLMEFNSTQGMCPICNSKDDVLEEMENEALRIPKLNLVFDDLATGCISYVYIRCHCKGCGTYFNQLYKLQYAGQEITK